MISIIVPVYNTEEYLRKCLDSIVKQTYKDLEIVLVDDGSSDSSGLICNEYALLDGRIIVIHKSNAGQSAARNDALMISTGEYIGFVDSDDTCHPRMFEYLATAIGLKDIAFCRHHESISNNVSFNSEQVLHYRDLNRDDLWDEIVGRLNNAVWNKLYRRAVAKKVKFTVGMRHGEDFIFNIEVLSRCTCGVMVENELYNYIRHGNSITNSNFSDKSIMEIESKDRILELVERLYPRQRLNALAHCFRARMNIMRAIYTDGLQSEYSDFLQGVSQYVKNHYKEVKKSLRTKEKIEFVLYKWFPAIYRIAIKVV